MSFIRTLYAIFMLFFMHTAHAESTITITLINKSKYEFTKSKIPPCEGCRLKIDNAKLKPGETAIIEATITADIDFDSNIYFNDDKDRFHINVNRLKAYGRPILIMHSKNVKSKVDQKSLRFNHDNVPTHLAYTAATVYLE